MVGDSAVRVDEELPDLDYFGAGVGKSLKLLNRLFGVEPRMIDNLICLLDRFPARSRNPGPLHAHSIHSYDCGGIAVCGGEGRHVLYDLGAACDHGVIPYTAELMHGRNTRDKREVSNRDMASKHGAVRVNAVISKNAVVSHMEVAHEIVVIPNDCRGLRF